jgi:hypothetical protein
MSREMDIDTLARTLYGEAEAGNGLDARAIACVIMNRTKFALWPNEVRAVCMQPWQFSCWNQNDPNRARILNASGEWFERCKDIAKDAIDGAMVHDQTKGSTHYYATYVKTPKWAKGKKPVYSVRHKAHNSEHLFFNDIDTKPPVTAAEALDQSRPLGDTSTVTAAKLAVTGAAGIGGAAEYVNQAAPAMPLLLKIMDFAPWMMVGCLSLGIGFMVWSRIQDRRKGLR